jgi:glutamate dehydrogenase
MTAERESRAEFIDQIRQMAKSRLEGERGEAAAAFLSAYYAHVPVDELAQPVDHLYGAGLAIWQFARARAPGAPKLRVYVPRLAEHGWVSPHAVIEIVNDDMPFLVDSVIGELNHRDLTIHRLAHPIVEVERDAGGVALRCGSGASESFIHVEIDDPGDAAKRDELAARLLAVLADVRAAVEDWRAMLGRLDEVRAGLAQSAAAAGAAEIEGARKLLAWLAADNFTFLGYRRYAFEAAGDPAADAVRMTVPPGHGLGLLRDDSVVLFDGLRNLATLPPDVVAFMREPRPLLVTKANRRSTVHRTSLLDAIGVKILDPSGKVVGQHLFAGLFTSMAINQSPRQIPVLADKVSAVLARAGFAPASHDGKALTHILETFPRDELWQASVDELFAASVGILRLHERQRTALFVRRDLFERFVSCLVFVPRDRYDTDLRKRIQAILEQAFGGTVTAFQSQFADETALVRVHFLVQTRRGQIPDYHVAEITRRIADAARGFAERLREAIVDRHGEEKGLALLRRYEKAFPAAYRERFTPDLIVADLPTIDAVVEGRVPLAVDLYRTVDSLGNELRLRTIHRGRPVPLSEVLPILENLGLRVMTEDPFRIEPAGAAEPAWLQDFTMVAREVKDVDLSHVKSRFEEILLEIWNGSAANDGFNRLALTAGLSLGEIIVLRAYARYLRQIGIPYSQAYIEDALAQNGAIVVKLIALFRMMHTPKRPADAGTQAKGIVVEIEHLLDAVTNLDQDRILRRILNLLQATLRTNYFQRPGGKHKSYVSFKIDSRAVEDMPLPRPLVEVWVYSADVEAVHLRGGRVARGGIRWSDRPEDFRTEILGLMKAQMVKNAVIVPVGSKGGFFVKRPPPPEAGRDIVLQHGIECYRTFMRGLLDVTDNIAPDGIVPPGDVVRRDADDPYLVVAADKGTATFSDIANAISRAYGFWLDDAFASGGSAGYDHKGMAITARGAWEAVKRHFRELGLDTQSQDFTAVGVGDMSGDVFGNGLLRSRHTRLLAAFDHRHVFVDPSPDAAASFAERERLFKLPRSSWADYDAKLISAGGGVFDRKAKSIRTTPEMRALFSVGESVTPADLMKAILKAPVDLLFFGGIGTYVKASSETHADAGDRANDALRVDARELRARVVGEGANLGVTQRGRIEYAQAGAGGTGGKINTDAIDNSAGVDTSDHEVNIKILLGDVVARGDMTLKQRDQLLAAMTDEVAALVLADNYLQTQALSVAEAEGAAGLDSARRFMRGLEKAGRLNRAIEFLPDEEELRKRHAAGRGLTRPELAVLLAYAKLTLYDQLLPSGLPDDAALAVDLTGYFPTPLRSAHAEAIARHRLRREIIATVATNDLVNRMGPFFLTDLVERGVGDAAEVARAYLVARDVFTLPALWRDIEALDAKVPAKAQVRAFAATQALIARAAPWLVASAAAADGGARTLDIEAARARYAPGIAALAAALGRVVDDGRAAEIAEDARALEAEGLPPPLARRVAALPDLCAGLDIVRIAGDAGPAATAGALEAVARVYFAIGARLHITWLARKAAALAAGGAWQRRAAEAMVADLAAQQADLARRIIAAGGPDPVAAWLDRQKPALARLDGLVAELRAAPGVDLAALTVAARELRALM